MKRRKSEFAKTVILAPTVGFAMDSRKDSFHVNNVDENALKTNWMSKCDDVDFLPLHPRAFEDL